MVKRTPKQETHIRHDNARDDLFGELGAIQEFYELTTPQMIRLLDVAKEQYLKVEDRQADLGQMDTEFNLQDFRNSQGFKGE